jgi:GTP-binding protein
VIIKTVEFAGAIARVGGEAPAGLKQVAFSGRSNVGKSSLINRLLGRTRTPIAKVSSTPGKTQQINFFHVRAKRQREEAGDVDFYLVDLPGYGYARAPLEVRASWKPLIESYLRSAQRLIGVVQLIDARQGATVDDKRMVAYLAETGLPTLFALTKVDKLSGSERQRQLDRVANQLGADPEQVVAVSSRTGEGRAELLTSLEALLTEENA